MKFAHRKVSIVTTLIFKEYFDPKYNIEIA